MPGIAGIIGSHLPEGSTRILKRMLSSMLHEPSYVTGHFAAVEFGLLAGWVALPGSFSSKQSGVQSHRGISLAIAGECYADSTKAVQPSEFDTANWLIDRYEEVGDRFVASLNGLFSGLLIDHRQHRAFLFNDRYGLERVYVHESNGTTYFASEAKALLQVLPELRKFDNRGVVEFLTFGCTLGSTTLFHGVSLLPSGSNWIFSPTRPCSRTTYFSPTVWEAQPTLTASDFDAKFAETFAKILPRYLSETSRLGIALTGGLDTRMIMACLPESGAKPVTYTFAGESDMLLDAKLAARIARARGLRHHILKIDGDFLGNFGHFVDRSVYISDGCCGALGAHEIYFNQAAAELAPIRLTGNYGSEVLRSVSTFKPTRLNPRLLAPPIRAAAATVCGHLQTAIHPITFAAFQEIPWNLMGTLLTGRSQVTFRTPYLDNELVALAYRAPTTIRSSPLSALRLIEKAHPELSRIPTDRGHIGTERGPAWMLRRIFSEVTFKIDYLRTEGLPGALAPLNPLIDVLAPTGMLGLHKFLPYTRWFRNELRPHLEGIFTDPKTRALPFFESAFLTPMLAEHSRGRSNYSREINAVLTLEAVDRLLLKTISRF